MAFCTALPDGSIDIGTMLLVARRAFSLVEAAITLVVLATLASVGTVSFLTFVNGQRDAAARAGMTSVLDAQELNWISYRYLGVTPPTAAVVAPMYDHADEFTPATTSRVSTGGITTMFAAHALMSASGKCVTGFLSFAAAPNAAGFRVLELFPPTESRPCTARTARLEALPPPGQPVIVVADPAITSVALEWNTPVPGTLAILDYQVEYSLSEQGPWTVFDDGVSDLTTAVVTGLAPDTPYWFRVTAINEVGPGTPSAPTSATTLPDTPGPVEGLTATLVVSGCASGGQCIDLTWSPPESGGAPVGYRVWVWDPSTSTFVRLTDPDLDPSGPLVFRFDPASPSTTYTFQVAAIGALGGVSPAVEVTETTAAPPTAPGLDGLEGGEG